MALNLEGPIESIEECSAKEFNIAEINSIKTRYNLRREESKGPTFALT